MFADFVNVLSKTDDLIILDTYAASEASIDGASAIDLCHAINQANSSNVAFAKRVEDVVEWMNHTAEEDHVVMVQGAGDVSRVSDLLKSS